MARRSLSSQVIEEVDRARGLVGSMQDSADPIFGILLGTVLESLHRIEGMCLRAMQADMNAVTTDTPLGTAFAGDKLSQVRGKTSGASHRIGSKRAPK